MGKPTRTADSTAEQGEHGHTMLCSWSCWAVPSAVMPWSRQHVEQAVPPGAVPQPHRQQNGPGVISHFRKAQNRFRAARGWRKACYLRSIGIAHQYPMWLLLCCWRGWAVPVLAGGQELLLGTASGASAASTALTSLVSQSSVCGYPEHDPTL